MSLSWPESIAVDPSSSGNVHVADTANNKVQVHSLKHNTW
jgi:hypothetical protein